jgi:hypothetical protein
MGAWDYVKLILGSEYTLFSAIIGASMANLAAFGTDQDMVQRLLTAETYKKSRRSLITAAIMDIPIGAAFTFIGILLFVYYKLDPRYKPRRIRMSSAHTFSTSCPQEFADWYLAGVVRDGDGIVVGGAECAGDERDQ